MQHATLTNLELALSGKGELDLKRLLELLDEREWTWADLAEAMKMSKSTISRVVHK